MMLRCAIVYTTLNDNTRRLAECMYGALPRGVCLYMGKPCRQALAADVIFCGNNAGIQSAEIDAFLEQAKQRRQRYVRYRRLCLQCDAASRADAAAG